MFRLFAPVTNRRLLQSFVLIFGSSLLLSTETVLAQPDAAEETRQWISLFNGEDLTGWTPKLTHHELGDNYGNTFRVNDGALQVRYDQYDGDFGGRFGHLFYETPYSHYILRFEYRVVGEQCPGAPGWAIRNSGAMLHCQDPATIELDQDFPVSIEGQLLGGDGTHPRPTLNVCTPGTNIVMDDRLVTAHCRPANAETYHGDQWVSVQFEVRGSEIIRHLAGDTCVLEYQKPQYDLGDRYARSLFENTGKDADEEGALLIESGYISLQAEGHPFDFRNIEICDLSEPATGEDGSATPANPAEPSPNESPALEGNVDE